MLVSLLAFLLPMTLPALASSSSLVISEIAYRGTVASDNCKATTSSTFNCNHDKWVELYNPTATPVNLNSYKLAYGAQGSGYTETRGLSGTIAPNSYFVIGNKTNTLMTNLSGYDLLLPNLHFLSRTSGDSYIKVGLLDSNSKSIDSVNLSSGQLANLEAGFDFAKSKYSLEFNQGTPNVNKSNTYGRSSDYLNYGTPGFGFLVPLSKSSEPDSEPVAVKPTVKITPVIEVQDITPIKIATPEPVPAQLINPAPVVSLSPSQVFEPTLTTQVLPQASQAVSTAANPSQTTVEATAASRVTESQTTLQSRAMTTSTESAQTTLETTAVSSITESQTTLQPTKIAPIANQSTPITPALATAKVSQSSYELILIILAINAIIFVSYLVFDYNYNRIKQFNLDKITNIVSY